MVDSVKQHKHRKIDKITFGLLIVSDSRAQQYRQSGKVDFDKTTQVVDEIIKKTKWKLKHFGYVPDEGGIIYTTVKKIFQNEGIDVLITSGGTGISKRDVTIECLRPILEKELIGFSIVFQLLSYQQVGSATVLSRATAGVIGDKVIFILPGSPNAVRLALNEIILPEIEHILTQVRGK